MRSLDAFSDVVRNVVKVRIFAVRVMTIGNSYGRQAREPLVDDRPCASRLNVPQS
jgi:hypothetical protein